jgi:two-component system nitrogen regulation response regulator GlnG
MPPALAVRLVRYSWPGNIRQLRNLTRQIVISSRRLPTLKSNPHIDQELDGPPPLLPDGALSGREGLDPAAALEQPSSRRKPSEVSDQEMLKALRATSWDLKAAAEQLGITRSSLYMLIDRSSSLRTAVELSVSEITHCFHECKGDLDAMVQRLEVSRRGLQRRVKNLGLGES